MTWLLVVLMAIVGVLLLALGEWLVHRFGRGISAAQRQAEVDKRSLANEPGAWKPGSSY